MKYEITNGQFTAVIESYGAELQSFKKDGHEYIWEGDPAYWHGHGPNLFPFVGRLFEQKYKLHGKTYEMGIHGFAKIKDFQVIENAGSRITFEPMMMRPMPSTPITSASRLPTSWQRMVLTSHTMCRTSRMSACISV